jgi:hypothetical protein
MYKNVESPNSLGYATIWGELLTLMGLGEGQELMN